MKWVLNCQKYAIILIEINIDLCYYKTSFD